MRKCVGILMSVALLAGLVAIAGCGAEEGVIMTPQGRLQFKAGKITVQTPRGEEDVNWTVKQTEANALGIPVPAGATLARGSAAVVKSDEQSETWTGAQYWSDMSVDEAIAFYRDKLSSKAGFSDTSKDLDGDMVGLFSFDDNGMVKSVIVGAGQSGDPGKTKISMAVVKS